MLASVLLRDYSNAAQNIARTQLDLCLSAVLQDVSCTSDDGVQHPRSNRVKDCVPIGLLENIIDVCTRQMDAVYLYRRALVMEGSDCHRQGGGNARSMPDALGFF